MDWIRKNPAAFALIGISVCVLAATGLLFSRVSSFAESFGPKPEAPRSTEKPKVVEFQALTDAREALGKPAVWQPAAGSGVLLTSRLYVLKDGKLVTLERDRMFNPPVPNAWLQKYGLEILNSSVLDSDPDNDGFTTRQEWEGNDGLSHLDAQGRPVIGPDGQPLPDDSTNPIDPKSHPPYHTRLRIIGFENKPFPLLFRGYDINPRNPKDITVQINPTDGGRRTQFVTLGEDIPGTEFKTSTLERKEIPGPDGTRIDASELTVINKRTEDSVVLPLGKRILSPDTLIHFKYLWVQPGGQPTPDFTRRKGDTFSLPPENDKTYKIIDIKTGEVVIELPSGVNKAFKPSK